MLNSPIGPADCVFCRIVAGDLPATIVLENEDVVAFDDVSPLAPVHVLVVPRRHTESIRAMDDDRVAGALLRAAHRAAAARGIEADGYRLVFNVGGGIL